jgi:hypothetical protein
MGEVPVFVNVIKSGYPVLVLVAGGKPEMLPTTVVVAVVVVVEGTGSTVPPAYVNLLERLANPGEGTTKLQVILQLALEASVAVQVVVAPPVHTPLMSVKFAGSLGRGEMPYAVPGPLFV